MAAAERAAALARRTAYILANDEMDTYLDNILDVEDDTLRLNLMKGGFRVPAVLAKKKDKFISQMCNNIRKGDGNSVTKNIGAELQENLQKFQT